jgi:hypothetical protein
MLTVTPELGRVGFVVLLLLVDDAVRSYPRMSSEKEVDATQTPVCTRRPG